MGTILILGHGDDLCCSKVQERLLSRGCQVLYLPEDRILPGLDFVWEVQGRTLRGRMGYGGQQAEFEEIDAVLTRSYGIPVSPETFATTDGRYVCSEWNALTMAWLASLPCRVVNRLRPELWYRVSVNVPALASLVPGAPFKRPRTMVTTRVEDARDFQRRCGGRVRFEPLTQPVGYRVDGEEGIRKLAALAGTLPFQLTEIVEGERVEAFVVRDRVVMMGLDRSVVPEPPGHAADDARAIARALGLAFCRLALVHAAGDSWYFLGAERIPQLYDCGEDVQDLVVEHLADLLATGPGERGRP
jgi:hypothetical protein